jgi:hypothetical protein
MSGYKTKIIKENLPVILAVVAALLFNNWLLGFILNPHIIFTANAISDLSSAGQPHAMWFQLLDILSGITFVLLGVLLIREKYINDAKTIAIASIILGLANILDATSPVECTYQCKTGLYASLSHLHTYTSVVIVATLFVLTLSGLLFAIKNDNQKLKLLSLGTTAFTIFSIVFALVIFLINHSFSSHGYGPVQELQMIIFGIWLVYFCYLLSNSQHRLASNLQHR